MDENLNNKQNHKVTIFAIILSVVSLGVLIFGFMIVSSDKVIMLQSISNLYNKVNGSFEDEFVLINKISNSKDCGMNIKNVLKIGKDSYNVNINYLENRFDNRSRLDLSISSLDNSLSSSYVLDNNILYTLIKDVTDDYYYKNTDKYSYTSFLKNLSQADYEKLLSLLKEEVNDIISNDKITKEKVTINYNNSSKKVTKLTYNLTKDDIKKVIKDLISEIKEDKNLTNNILNLLDTDAVKFKDYIKNYLDDSSNSDKEYVYSYSIYYYGFNKIVKYELYSHLDDVLFSYLDEDTNGTINISNGNNNIFELVIDSNNNFKFNGNISYIIDKLGLNKDNYFINLLTKDFTGSYDGTHLELLLNETDNNILKFNLTLNLGTIDNVYKYNSNLSVSTIADNIKENEKILYNLTSDIEFIFDKKIDVDLTNSINYLELPDEDKKLIEDNLNNNTMYQIIRDNGLLEYFN